MAIFEKQGDGGIVIEDSDGDRCYLTVMELTELCELLRPHLEETANQILHRIGIMA
jgi:hypothetical protein